MGSLELNHIRNFVEICSSISRELFSIVGFAYVDDCDLIQSGLNTLIILNSMQSLIDSWGDLMGVTGGEINVEKSWWYMMEYVWKKGNWVASDASLDYDLIVQSPDGLPISLYRLYVSEASEMLAI